MRCTTAVQLSGSTTNQDWECYRCFFDGLDDPHGGEAEALNQRKQVNSKQFNVAQVDVVWLILDWHQYNQHTIVEL